MAWIASLPFPYRIALAIVIFLLFLILLLFAVNECWNHRRSSAGCIDWVRSERFDGFVRWIAAPIYAVYAPPSWY